MDYNKFFLRGFEIMTIKEYNGELKDIDSFQYGIKLKNKNSHCYDEDSDLTRNYYSNNQDEQNFLSNFYKQMVKGFYFREREIDLNNYKEGLIKFQKNIDDVVKVGCEVYIKLPKSKVKIKVRVEFITEEKDKVVVRYSDNGKIYNDSNIKILGYENPSEFVQFFDI
jgi:hypothetical protein